MIQMTITDVIPLYCVLAAIWCVWIAWRNEAWLVLWLTAVFTACGYAATHFA